MRKVTKLVVAVGLIAALAGCSADPEVVNQNTGGNNSRFHGIQTQEVNIITDSETGCKYIYLDDGNASGRAIAITPLMKDARTVDCSN